jgi:deoxyribonuclease-4
MARVRRTVDHYVETRDKPHPLSAQGDVLMPLFGAHMSIAGGYHNALLAAAKYGCSTVQLFTKSSNQWRAKEISVEEAGLFRKTLREGGFRFPIAHDSYLINLASPDDGLYRKSVESFVEEVNRSEMLGLRYLVTHPGAHMGLGEERGLARVAAALDEVHDRCKDFRVQILLETTAGQGTSLGHRFEHLASILALVKHPDRVGVCFDTCHVFAAGYALSPAREYGQTFKAFERSVGLKKLRAFHLNDSQKPQGSRVDRHAHIGKGCLGLEPFRLLVNDRRFRSHPMILETPKETVDGSDMDRRNLATLRRLVQKRT